MVIVRMCTIMVICYCFFFPIVPSWFVLLVCLHPSFRPSPPQGPLPQTTSAGGGRYLGSGGSWVVVGGTLTVPGRPQNTRGHWGPPLSADPWYRIQGMGLVDNGGTTPPMAVGQDRLIQPPPTRSCMPLRGAAPSRRGWENNSYPSTYARWQEAPLSNTGGQSSIRWLTTGISVGPLPAAGFFEPPGPPPPDGPPKAVHLQPPQAEGGECPQFFSWAPTRGERP